MSNAQIKNVVVLMMENHSFDHMFGYLPGIGTLSESPQCLPDPAPNSSGQICTWAWDAYSIKPCPIHSHGNVMQQLYGLANMNQQPSDGVWPTPSMDGFLADYYAGYNYSNQPADRQAQGNPTQLMGCFTPDQLPALSMLATTFTVCTNWFCSVPGPTGTNRLFANCASAGGYAGPAYQYTDLPPQLATLPSVFDQLTSKGLTWQTYHECPLFFPEGILNSVNSVPDAVKADPGFHRFQNDVDQNKLPNYSFLTPSLPNSQHDSWDARVGDNVISLIYNTLLDSSCWEQALLVITYDEHGGHYDHVVPPRQYLSVRSGETVTVDNPDGKVWNNTWREFVGPEFDFTLLGPRVPAVIVSAYTPATVDNTVHEHASIPATLNDLWGFKPLTKRDAVANPLLGNVKADVRHADTLPRAPVSAIPKP